MLHMRNKRHTEINGCVDKDMRCVMVCVSSWVWPVWTPASCTRLWLAYHPLTRAAHLELILGNKRRVFMAIFTVTSPSVCQPT